MARDAGTIYPTATNALRYNTDMGQWQEKDVTFDASLLLKPGENTMTLTTVPAGEVTTGVGIRLFAPRVERVLQARRNATDAAEVVACLVSKAL